MCVNANPSGTSPTSKTEFDSLGRPIRRGYKRVHKEARKVVPKKNRDFKTLRGLINIRAYNMDVTHKQLADAIGCSKQLVDNTIAARATRKLHPWMVKAWAPLLALDAETEAKWLAWAEREKHIVPCPWKKKADGE